MGRTLRCLLGAVALCMMLLPSIAEAQYTPRDCCDVAAELLSAQDEFDVIDDRLTELDGNLQLGLHFQQQILMRNPFTEDDQQDWLNISNVILNINTEINELGPQWESLRLRIIALNQELSTCVPFTDDDGPLVPMPDPTIL